MVEDSTGVVEGEGEIMAYLVKNYLFVCFQNWINWITDCVFMLMKGDILGKIA